MSAARFSISQEEYQAERDARWPTIDPEDYCERCLCRNVVWFVASDRFNLAAEALGYDRAAILCPACFIEGHERATDLHCSWELRPGTHFSPRATSGGL